MIAKVKISGYRIFREFEFAPNQKLNLIVGGNESGKSTLLEAIVLALTGRVNGRRIAEEISPYSFNTDVVDEFVEKRREGKPAAFPEIRIELFLENRDELQQMCGAINSEIPTKACPGVSMRILPNPDYAEELEKWANRPSAILPVEYYMDDWRDFADRKLSYRPKELVTAIIDSRTVRSSSGVDFHLREILGEHLEPSERAEISLAYRRVKAQMSDEALKSVNERISTQNAPLHDREISLAMDQSPRTSWEGAITPQIDKIPFSMSGQGQQAAVKISLAMSRQSDRANFVMVEEPENHLSHTSLTSLVSRMASLAGKQQQLFVTTHSSFVLNRLGLDSLLLVGANGASRIPELRPETVSYFRKLPGYDTLRMVLARKLVLVEGPSDEIVFSRVFSDLFGRQPMECGIDVLSMRGLSLARCLELCAVLDRPVAALRDNDGNDPDDLRASVEQWLSTERRDLFVGETRNGRTLEPQLISCNEEKNLRKILEITSNADLLTWMTREKTETALRIADSTLQLQPPGYMRRAAEFIHG